MALATLLKAIYYFTQDDAQHRMVRALGINASLTSKICRRLQNVCSVDLQNRPFIPFGGPGTVAKCDESKFNHKPKVNGVTSTISVSLNKLFKIKTSGKILRLFDLADIVFKYENMKSDKICTKRYKR